MSKLKLIEARQEMPDEEYHAIRCPSKTSIKKGIEESMREMHTMITEGMEPTEDMRIGTIVHMAIFEPERFERAYVFWEGTGSTKGWKAYKEEYGEDNIIKTGGEKGWDKLIKPMIDVIKASEWYGDGFKREDCEYSIIAEHETGLRVKGRIDLRFPERHHFDDLKSTMEKSAIGLKHAVRKLNYNIDAGVYGKLHEAAFGVFPSCNLKFITKTKRPELATVEIPYDRMAEGWYQADQVLHQYAKCLENNHFPGRFPEIIVDTFGHRIDQYYPENNTSSEYDPFAGL